MVRYENAMLCLYTTVGDWVDEGWCSWAPVKMGLLMGSLSETRNCLTLNYQKVAPMPSVEKYVPLNAMVSEAPKMRETVDPLPTTLAELISFIHQKLYSIDIPMRLGSRDLSDGVSKR